MNKKKAGIFFVFAGILLFSLSFYNIYQVNGLVIENIDKVHNSYVSDYDISDTQIEKLGNKLNEIEKDVIVNEITLTINGKNYNYSLYEIGITINKEEIENDIKEYEDDFDYWTLYNNYSKNSFDEKVYEYNFVIDEEKLDRFLKNLKRRVDVTAQDGTLQMGEDRVLKYVDEVVGFELDIAKSKEIILNNFKTNHYQNIIELTGENIYTDDILKTIDTKVSSFTTTFDDTVSRKYNLIAGAKLLDGKIIYPDEIFSFYENAGPYNRANGYVYYSGVLGNGVCQVATTLYNTELLAGLTTIKRYGHGIKSVYVDGGLDATVSVTRGMVTDFKFQNTYEYPIYISAFVDGDKLTIEFWSNKDAKKGLEYQTESVRVRYGSYRSYRHVYKDGELVDTEFLGATHYFEE